MRKTSKEQTAASQINGGRSNGPKSEEGKKKSSLNSLKDAIFAKGVVVTAAGERVKDYADFKAWVWDSVHPDNALEEILTNDIVVNWWQRQRVRRCASAALENRLQNLQLHDCYLRSDDIEPVKVRFQLYLGRYETTTAATPSDDVYEIVTELENARRELASTTVGLEFLISKVHAVKREAKSGGQISNVSEVVLQACGGIVNDFALYSKTVNLINKMESAKAAERASTGGRGGAGQTKETARASKDDRVKRESEERTQAQGGRFVLVSLIKDLENELVLRKKLLELGEKEQRKTHFAANVLPTDSTYDRFERAETTYERRLYRALGALLTIKRGKDTSKMLH
jgi:hypothetical protein